VETAPSSDEVIALRNELGAVKRKNTELRRTVTRIRRTLANASRECVKCGHRDFGARYPDDGGSIDYEWLCRFTRVAAYLQSTQEHERHSAADHVQKMLSGARLSMAQLLGDDAIPVKRLC
jgi:hypothetical protein